MDGIYGVIDGSFKLSLVDSTMMSIVHRAMDKAHEKVKSKERGIIERLHEISKFYELSVMQLDGCIKFVQHETDIRDPDTSHEEVLLGLAEIRNRLQRRLYESDLAILHKDRELADRFENDSNLRQALETTETELVFSLARSTSGDTEDEINNRDGDQFGELKDSLDPQVSKIREKLEFDDYDDDDDDDDDEPVMNKRNNHCINNDVIRVEEMGSDIDFLKETLDIAFGKMQTALFCSEMGPIDQQIKSSIENDVISISLKGFVRDSHDNLQEEARRNEEKISVTLNEHWSDFMNEVTGLCDDLRPLISQNLEEYKILDFGSRSPEREEKISQLRQELIQKKISLSSGRRDSSVSLEYRFQEVLGNLMVLNAKVNRSVDQNESFNEEEIPLEREEQVFTEIHRQNSDAGTLEDVWRKIHKRQEDGGYIGKQNQICLLRQEKEDREFQNMMMEEIYITLFKGLREKFCNDLSSWEKEILISEDICRDLIRNMFDQMDETLVSYKIESQIKDDIYHVVFKEAMKDYDFELDRSQDAKDENHPSRCFECEIRQEIYGIPSAEMLKEWQKNIEEHTIESLLREEISQFVFGETIKSIRYFDDFLRDSQITIQEDVCLVFFREMVGEWEEKIEACNLDTSLREEICYTIVNEAEREVCNRYRKVDVTEQPPNTGMEGLIQKISLLSEGIEELENLVLSASFEKMPSSVESKDIQCLLNSLSNKLEKTMKQINNKLFVGELKSSLETIVSESEKVCQISPDRKISLSELHNMQLNKSDICYEFELMANKKLEATMLRLEDMKRTLDPLPRVIASLRENESLYKKAFIRRCQNLRKAENEVDLLGDQVDILLNLIEKIYLILNQHSPVLQQYVDVSEILRLIKKEVAAIVCKPPQKLDTSSDHHV